MDCQVPNNEKHLEHLNKYASFELNVHLKHGANLSVQDISGSSDPYVRFYVCDKKAYKSKTVTKSLNPKWDEKFTLAISDVSKPILIKVFDFNRVIQDDFMGEAHLYMTNLEPNKLTDMEIILQDSNQLCNLGQLLISVTLEPKSYKEKENISIKQTTSSFLTPELIDGRKLKPMDSDGLSDPYVKLSSVAVGDRSSVDGLDNTFVQDWKKGTKSDQMCVARKVSDLKQSPDQLDSSTTSLRTDSGSQSQDINGEVDQSHKLDDQIIYSSLVEQDNSFTFQHKISHGSSISGPDDVEESYTNKLKIREQQNVKLVPNEERERNNIDMKQLVQGETMDNGDDFEVTSNENKYAFFDLHVHLKQGVGLSIQDISGSSDPYVKFIVGDKKAHKSKIITKSLNPFWDERFTLDIGDISKPVLIKVFDFNRGLKDDFMGMAHLEMTKLVPNKLTEIEIFLRDSEQSCNMGKLLLSVTLEEKINLTPITEEQELIQTQITSSIVILELIEATKLKPMDSDVSSDPYVKLRLGKVERKSSCKNKTLSPCWHEQFHLRLHSNQSNNLEITVWDKNLIKDDFMGRCKVDLSQLEHEKTHELCLKIKEGMGQIFAKIKITGLTGKDKVEDLLDYEEESLEKEVNEDIAKRYALTHTFSDIRDVGYLQVKVFCAQGLAAEDIGGTSNPYCVLELNNSQLETDIVLKTLSPSWNKIFHFNVKDIHSCLEVTVLDDDGNKKPDFLGKIVIPLIRIKNGEKKWYVLKNKSLRNQAKGKFPEILLECSVQWNLVRATVRSLTYREDKFMDKRNKFRVAKFNRNIAKFKPYITDAINVCALLKSVWNWENPGLSCMAYILALFAIYNFEFYMLPLALVFPFLKNSWMLFVKQSGCIEDYVDLYKGDTNYEDENEVKRSPLDWIQLINQHIQIEELMFKVQKVVGDVVSSIERCQNTLHFTVPFLSWILVALLLIVTTVLYLIPVRYLVMMLGTFSFLTKLVRSQRGQHLASSKAKEAIYAFLTCMPDDEDLLDAQELCNGSEYNHSSSIIEDVTSDDCKRKISGNKLVMNPTTNLRKSTRRRNTTNSVPDHPSNRPSRISL